MSTFGRIMAIDYGSVRIGIALSDPMRIIAKPFCVIPNNGSAEIILKLLSLIQENRVELLILGIPYGMEGQNTQKTDETLLFQKELEAALPIPLKPWNECLSTVEATNALKKMGYNWKESRHLVDAMAACMILKSYLESNP